jgi:hypothetical protein
MILDWNTGILDPLAFPLMVWTRTAREDSHSSANLRTQKPHVFHADDGYETRDPLPGLIPSFVIILKIHKVSPE